MRRTTRRLAGIGAFGCGARVAAAPLLCRRLLGAALPLAIALAPAVGAQSLADRLKAVQSGQADHPRAQLPVFKALSAAGAAPAIPMVKGLVVVTAINMPPAGDYESIKSIVEVSSDAVQLNYSANRPTLQDKRLFDRPKDLGQADPMHEFPDKVSCRRTIDLADLQKAAAYSEYFCGHQVSSEHFPGTTSISTSTAVLEQLRAGQSVAFHFASNDFFAAFAQLGAQLTGEKPTGPQLTSYAGQMMYTCNLHRVGTSDVAVPVLLNDKPVDLPAVHAMCTLGDQEAHFFWLDQPANPVTLGFSTQEGLLEVVKITTPPAGSRAAGSAPQASGSAAGGAAALAQALADRKPVRIYGIYFDFNSATIKPESEPVLHEIVAVMQQHPDWKLSVSGFTDNIGGDKSNLALSQRRSAAVKAALVSRFKIDASRLVTAGYGASSPVDTNDTLEGRARNRRVELQRV